MQDSHALVAPARTALTSLLTRHPGPIRLLSHDDADGLAAAVVLHRALEMRGTASTIRLVGRFERAWGGDVAAEVAREPSAVIATDLGVPEAVPFPNPTLILDHHVPLGDPSSDETTVVSGDGVEPAPCSSILAWMAAGALCDATALAWIAALGAIGDFGEKSLPAFGDLRRAAVAVAPMSALKAATALINAPRRSSHGDASAALTLLRKAERAQDITSGLHAETRALEADRDEVARELQVARRVAPIFAGPVALLRTHSRCQIHPLVAQAWTGRLRRNVVIAANSGYRDGFVHFAVRSDTEVRLVDLLQGLRPGALAPDESFAGGHQRASGGAVRAETWRQVARDLGFAPEAAAPPFVRGA